MYVCTATAHGHCGIVVDGEIENDESVEILAKIALSHAKAGADYVCASDMMDGRVLSIRKTLEASGFSSTGILAYSVKYALPSTDHFGMPHHHLRRQEIGNHIKWILGQDTKKQFLNQNLTKKKALT